MANKFKDMMDPKLWFKNEKDKKLLLLIGILKVLNLKKKLQTKSLKEMVKTQEVYSYQVTQISTKEI